MGSLFYVSGMDMYRVKISRRDMAAAYALTWRRILRKPWVLLAWAAVIIIVTFAVGDNPLGILTSPRRLVAAIGIPAIGWGLMYLLIPPLSGWIAGRWQYDNYPMLHREIEVMVEDTGLKFLSAGDQWRHKWSDYLDVAEDRQVMLLYVSSQLFQILPVAAVPADVRAIIAARIKDANGKAARGCR